MNLDSVRGKYEIVSASVGRALVSKISYDYGMGVEAVSFVAMTTSNFLQGAVISDIDYYEEDQ